MTKTDLKMGSLPIGRLLLVRFLDWQAFWGLQKYWLVLFSIGGGIHVRRSHSAENSILKEFSYFPSTKICFGIFC